MVAGVGGGSPPSRSAPVAVDGRAGVRATRAHAIAVHARTTSTPATTSDGRCHCPMSVETPVAVVYPAPSTAAQGRTRGGTTRSSAAETDAAAVVWPLGSVLPYDRLDAELGPVEHDVLEHLRGEVGADHQHRHLHGERPPATQGGDEHRRDEHHRDEPDRDHVEHALGDPPQLRLPVARALQRRVLDLLAGQGVDEHPPQHPHAHEREHRDQQRERDDAPRRSRTTGAGRTGAGMTGASLTRPR